MMRSFKQPGAFDALVTMDDRLVALSHVTRLDLFGQLVRRGIGALHRRADAWVLPLTTVLDQRRPTN
jgi:hypothetical protein